MKVELITSASYEFYKVYPYKGLSAITAQIKSLDFGTGNLGNKKEINWFCQGATSIKDTKLFIKALQKAVKLCENGINNDNKI